MDLFRPVLEGWLEGITNELRRTPAGELSIKTLRALHSETGRLIDAATVPGMQEAPVEVHCAERSDQTGSAPQTLPAVSSRAGKPTASEGES
jgi:hypothetical protein